MKPLTDLISKCQDVEEKAESYMVEKCRGFAISYRNTTEEERDAFKAGAASQSPIADALREAIKQRDLWFKHVLSDNHGAISQQHLIDEMKEDDELLCRILEGKE